MELERITLQVCKLCTDIAAFQRLEISNLQGGSVEQKGIHDFVTHIDKESERRIVDRLSQLLPDAGFIAEESPHLKPADYTWVIDPLDGTTNYIHGVPLYCISIGLLHHGRPVAGVIYEVNQQECFYTWQGAPSYLNGLPIQVSQTPDVDHALLATGFPYYDYSFLDAYLDLFRYLLKNSRGLRRLGSAAADLAYVAAGRFDGFFEYGLSPWDVAAGTLIVQNAGGVVTDFTGSDNPIFGRQIIATNPHLNNEFLNLFGAWKKS